MSRDIDTTSVLLVDDDELLWRAYERSCPANVHLFFAADAGSARMLALRYNLHLAVIDLCLGRESGIDLIGEFRRIQPDAAVVLISSYASVEMAVRAVRAGAQDVLEKPVRLSEILARMTGTTAATGGGIEPITLARAQWEHVQRVLSDCAGNISLTARKLGIYRTTLRRWLQLAAPRPAGGTTRYR